jgi:hypothetical protein
MMIADHESFEIVSNSLRETHLEGHPGGVPLDRRGRSGLLGGDHRRRGRKSRRRPAGARSRRGGRSLHRALDVSAQASLGTHGRYLPHPLWVPANSAYIHPVLHEPELGRRGRWGVGSGGLLGHLRHGLCLFGLADGHLSHRGQPSPGLPVPDHDHRVASGIIFFGETLGIEKIVGGAVILLGVYLARRQ